MSVEQVWVLSSGDYSDYRVLCAVRSEADGIALAARYNAIATYEDAMVESLELVDADVERVEVLILTIQVWDDETTDRPTERVNIEWPFNSYNGTPDCAWRWVRAPMHSDKGGRLEVWGTDKERVRHVFGDMRTRLLTDAPFRARREVKSA